MFKILSSVVNGAKGAVTSSVKGASDVLSATINAVKNVTVSAFKETGTFCGKVFRCRHL